MESPRRSADRWMIAIAIVVGIVLLGVFVWWAIDFLMGFRMD